MLASVIIPALNEAENIRDSVEAARRDYDADEVEIIVVDGGSTDGTADLVPDGVTLLRAPRGRAVQMNRGAEASCGDILVFCHGDSQLPAGWREAVMARLERPGVSGGAFQSLLLPERGLALWVHNKLRYPSFWFTMFGDQAQFMSRATYRKVGGFPEIPLMEDMEMSRALHREGELVRVPLRAVTSSRRLLERGYFRQMLQNMWSAFRYLLLGATPEDIARAYRSSREEEM